MLHGMVALSTTATSGFVELDAVLGGIFWGDNVVLHAVSEQAELEALVTGFEAAEGYRRRGRVAFVGAAADGVPSAAAPAAREPASCCVIGDGDVEAAIASTLAYGQALGAGGLIIFDDLALLAARLGEAEARRFFVRVCPTLLRVGAVAVWRLGAAVDEETVREVTRITQLVLEISPDRLLVIKAEARPPETVGSTLVLRAGPAGLALERGEDVSRLGSSLLAQRLRRGFSQAELARLAGITPSAMSQAERGQRGLAISTLVRLAFALGITLDELVLGQEEASYRIRGRTAPHGGGASRVALVDAAAEPYRLHEFRLDPAAHGSPPAHSRGVELVLLGRGLLMITMTDGTTPVIREGEALIAAGAGIADWRNLAEDQAVGFWLEV